MKDDDGTRARSKADWRLQIEEFKAKMTMERTITQNSALYLAQHTLSKRRAALFRRFRAAARNQSADVQQLRLGIAQRLHHDNGR